MEPVCPNVFEWVQASVAPVESMAFSAGCTEVPATAEVHVKVEMGRGGVSGVARVSVSEAAIGSSPAAQATPTLASPFCAGSVLSPSTRNDLGGSTVPAGTR